MAVARASTKVNNIELFLFLHFKVWGRRGREGGEKGRQWRSEKEKEKGRLIVNMMWVVFLLFA